MEVSLSDASQQRGRRAKLNSSSRTKTSREARRKDKKRSSVKQVQAKIEKRIQDDELLLPKLFDDATIDAILGELASETKERRKRVYTVTVTLSLFVQQVLAKDRGCKETVTLFNRLRHPQLPQVSTNTTSYCDARRRIPQLLIDTLVKQTADIATGKLKQSQLWRGRRVLLVDGIVVNAPDTPENQQVYPQSQSQKPGLGFPQIRLCAVICLATGVVADLEYGPVVGKKTGELTLFRKMFDNLKCGDLIVADSLYDSFRDHTALKAKGVDMICAKNGSRESPFTGHCKVIEETLKRTTASVLR